VKASNLDLGLMDMDKLDEGASDKIEVQNLITTNARSYYYLKDTCKDYFNCLSL
jgi:hypothetical protein